MDISKFLMDYIQTVEMPDFIRVTWIDVDRDKERDVTQEQKQTYELAVNLKENEPTIIINDTSKGAGQLYDVSYVAGQLTDLFKFYEGSLK